MSAPGEGSGKSDGRCSFRCPSPFDTHSTNASCHGTIHSGSQDPAEIDPIAPWEKATVNWDLRIAQDAGNIFSSLDGTIFVDQTLAQFLGSQAGLWAAALSHEITHVFRRDWARRYTLQESVEDDRASQTVLGTVAVSSGAWVDPMGSSAWIASCNRLMELEADAGSLTLMAKAGFHPDFVPPLHQALEAQPVQLRQDLRDPSHPRWDVRDEKLQKLLVAASKEYDRMWPARYASPGGIRRLWSMPAPRPRKRSAREILKF